MSFPKVISIAVIEHVKGHEDWNEIASLASATNAGLYNGPLSVEPGPDDENADGYPGFEKACRTLRDWLDDYATLYVEEDSGFVSDHEPQGEEFEGQWCEPMAYYALERRDIATILFGRELAQYL